MRLPRVASISHFYTAVFNASKGVVLDSFGAQRAYSHRFGVPATTPPLRVWSGRDVCSGNATADMSTSDEKVWQTTAIQNLARYRPSGTYFARFRVSGKLVWKSLKTAAFSVAKQRLPDTLRDHRSKLESFAAFADGKMTVAFHEFD